MGINLANQTGREGKLSAAYADAARAFSTGGPGFRLEPFDFHKQCGATNYERLGLLWEVGLLGAPCWEAPLGWALLGGLRGVLRAGPWVASTA